MRWRVVEFGGCCCLFQDVRGDERSPIRLQDRSSFRSSPRSALALIVSQGSPFATSAVIHFLEQTRFITCACRPFTYPVDLEILLSSCLHKVNRQSSCLGCLVAPAKHILSPPPQPCLPMPAPPARRPTILPPRNHSSQAAHYPAVIAPSAPVV